MNKSLVVGTIFLLTSWIVFPAMSQEDVTSAPEELDVVSDDLGIISEELDVQAVSEPTVTDVEPVVADTVSSDALLIDVSVEDTSDVSVTPPNTSGITVDKNNLTSEDVSMFISAIKDKNWTLLVGLILTFLVLILDKLVNVRQWVGTKGLPWVAASLGIVTHLGVALVNGVGWWDAILSGFISGATAVGLWELVFKGGSSKPAPTSPPPTV